MKTIGRINASDLNSWIQWISSKYDEDRYATPNCQELGSYRVEINAGENLLYKQHPDDRALALAKYLGLSNPIITLFKPGLYIPHRCGRAYSNFSYVVSPSAFKLIISPGAYDETIVVVEPGVVFSYYCKYLHKFEGVESAKAPPLLMLWSAKL